MKKNLLLIGVIVLSTFGLLVISFTSNSPATPKPEKKDDKGTTCRTKVEAPRNFHYHVGSRFSNTITREQLHHASSVNDITIKDAAFSIESMWEVELHQHLPGKDWIAKGDNDELTERQIEILQSMEYSSDYNITGLCKRKHTGTGEIIDGYFDHYFTVVPEKEASYEGGTEAVKDYLISSSSVLTNFLDPEQLHPGKIRFVVTKNGKISEVSVEASCGYENVDNRLVEIVKDMPEKWEAAENAEGKKIDQELVFFYGQIGC